MHGERSSSEQLIVSDSDPYSSSDWEVVSEKFGNGATGVSSYKGQRQQ